MKKENVKKGKEKGEEIRKAALVGVLAILVLSVSAAMVVRAQTIQPTVFYGNVTVNGEPAPVDTIVTGRIIGAVGSPGEDNITVTEAGKYGGPGGFDPKLRITTDNDDDADKTVKFYVKRPSDTEEIEADQTATFDSNPHQLDLTVTTGAPPNITSYAPETPVSDTEGATRTFNITVNQTVNVSWQINGTEVQTNGSVPADTPCTYTNESAVAGYWNVSAIATNVTTGLSDIQIWWWTVEPITYNLTISSTVGGSVTDPGEGTFTYNASEVVNLKAVPDAGYSFVNWTGDVGMIANVNSNETNITMNDNYTITANFNVTTVNGTIAGKILYTNATGTGIAGVTVNLTQGGSVINSTVTDANGNYSFTDISPGGYDVNASKTGFWDNSTTVTVSAGVTTEVNMMLWLKGDLDGDCTVAWDADDLLLMKRACLGLIAGDWKYDLNGNGRNADIGDLVLQKKAYLGI